MLAAGVAVFSVVAVAPQPDLPAAFQWSNHFNSEVNATYFERSAGAAELAISTPSLGPVWAPSPPDSGGGDHALSAPAPPSAPSAVDISSPTAQVRDRQTGRHVDGQTR